MVKDFIALTDFSGSELQELIDLAVKMKSSPDEYRESLKGKTLGMIFNKHSTRTRVSFEAGIYQLGGIGLFFGPNQLQINRGEPITDTAQVLSRYLDGIMIRTFDHRDVELLGEHSTIPIINGLTDYNHPCQVMADLLTIQEKFNRLEGLTLTYIGDGNNMATSLLFGGVKMGMNIHIVTPKDYAVGQDVIDKIKEEADSKNLTLKFTTDIEEGSTGANILYTDVWASMGQEEEQQKRLKAFSKYTIDDRVMQMADKNAIFMHCLPAHRGEEVSASVIDGPQSVIFDEAENRLHAQKAIMYTLMK
jgi:ornithine carbamoyltransferase